MAFSLLKRLKLFNANLDGNREREEDNNGEKRGILTNFKRKLANAKKVFTYSRRRKRETQSTVDWSLLGSDMWTEVAKHLEAKEMGTICSVSQWLNSQFSEGHLWKIAFLRDMKIADDCHVNASWKEIYASAFNGSHSFILHHAYWEGHTQIARRRLGAFSLTSRYVLLTHTLSVPSTLPPVLIEYSNKILALCILHNARIGIWISDYHRVQGLWNNTHIGVVYVLDARHCELFLEEGYNNGTWQYEDIAMTMIHSDVARSGIFNLAHMWSPDNFQFFCANTWAGIPTADGVKLRRNVNAVAYSANLEQNQRILVKYEVMKDGNGEVVSIRIYNFVV
ncbi:hypothetical protein LUZ63_016601 [Rhynchospora breviuscula]|uniref:F-box domain-containing protein n=1 Tax=Rhynchospora breviuscula TaxID=2022672 RepID=A0A9P9ZBL8_9POAL|nr:hypothetical protein LUZ63_016601 [Rhynchospora breviuscula]